jgi:hypothetical protein
MPPVYVAQSSVIDFEDDPAVVFMLDRLDRIVSCNAAWDQFALANDGETVLRPKQTGVCAFDVIASDLHAFYRHGFSFVRSTQSEWSHVYDCSSPSVFRQFHMRVLPAPSAGLLLINSLVVEEPAPALADFALQEYVDEFGFVKMCCHCRRTANPMQERWDWVPRFLNRGSTKVSHGLCPLCWSYHYPDMSPQATRLDGARQ